VRSTLPILALVLATACEPMYEAPPPQVPVAPPEPTEVVVDPGRPVVIVILNGEPGAVVAAPTVGLARRWNGTWSTPSGYKCSFELVLDTDARGWLDGYFVWKLLAAPRGSSQVARIGQSGREYVHGKYDPVQRRLDLSGYEVDNPRLLVTDEYHLALDAEGKHFAGRSRGDGGLWLDAIDGQAVVEAPLPQ
jgi:hypothetical protein